MTLRQSIPVYAENQRKGWYLGGQFRINPGVQSTATCVPVREEKKDEKGYFFLAVQHVAQSSFTTDCRKCNTMPVQVSLNA